MLHSLRKKILLGYGVVLILTLLVFLWAFINLLHLGQASDNILKRNYKSILAAEHMLDALERQNSAILLTLLGNHENLQPQFQEHASQFLQWLGKAQANITEPDEPEVLKVIEQGYAAYVLKFPEIQQSVPPETQPGVNVYHEQFRPGFALVREACLQLREINQNAMFQSSEKARKLAATARWSLMVVGVTAVGLGFGLSVLLSTLIVTQLKHLEQMKSEFVLAASHELRTPMTSINMCLELLYETAPGRLTEKERELMTAMREEVHRMRALINDLLDLSKIESGKMDMEFEHVPVSLCCEKALAPFERQAAEQALRLSFEPQPDLPAVRADANKITWVLTNLIGNALRYARTEICLSAEKVGTSVHISVRDDGIGIPLEYQTRIFDKFVQVKDPQHPGGTGLGLAICKEIVRAHGGTIGVDSVPDHGSTFTFTLPIG